jgi:hypothetical protein
MLLRLPWITWAERRRWRSATTLHDLGACTASWLLGEIASQPGYAPGYGPDEETEHLVPVLAAVNRLGYVTDNSQPGVDEFGRDGRYWTQQAAVCGLVYDPLLCMRLVEAAYGAGLTVVLHAARAPGEHAEGVLVTAVGGVPFTWFGRYLSARDLRTLWPEDLISPRAWEHITASWQLTLIDPVCGRDDVLWEALEGVVRQYQPASGTA